MVCLGASAHGGMGHGLSGSISSWRDGSVHGEMGPDFGGFSPRLVSSNTLACGKIAHHGGECMRQSTCSPMAAKM